MHSVLAIRSKHCSTECTKPALVELTTVHRSPRLSRPVTTPEYTEPLPALHLAAEATRCTGCRSGPGGTAGGLGSSAARPPSPPGDDVVQLRELEQLRPAARRPEDNTIQQANEQVASELKCTGTVHCAARPSTTPVPLSSNRDTRPYFAV
jgi:hypothetical protein